jgi:hypothetical protein
VQNYSRWLPLLEEHYRLWNRLNKILIRINHISKNKWLSQRCKNIHKQILTTRIDRLLLQLSVAIEHLWRWRSTSQGLCATSAGGGTHLGLARRSSLGEVAHHLSCAGEIAWGGCAPLLPTGVGAQPEGLHAAIPGRGRKSRCSPHAAVECWIGGCESMDLQKGGEVERVVRSELTGGAPPCWAFPVERRYGREHRAVPERWVNTKEKWAAIRKINTIVHRVMLSGSKKQIQPRADQTDEEDQIKKIDSSKFGWQGVLKYSGTV